MKGWITLNLLCETHESSEMKKIGVEVDASKLKYNPYKVQVSCLGSIGLSPDSNGSFINISGLHAETKESPLEIFKMIEKEQGCDHLFISESDNASLGNAYAKCSKCGSEPAISEGYSPFKTKKK